MKNERIFWGLFFIIGAVALIVGKLGFLQGINLWTVALTIFLAACLVKSIISRSMTGLLFSAAFLSIVYDEPLGITALTPWTVLFAALLGSIGFSILRKPRIYQKCHSHSAQFAQETVQGQRIYLDASFSGSTKYIRSDDFKGAELHCVCGGMKVYFDNAVIRDGRADLRLDVNLSGVELFVPKEWNVVNEAQITLGDIEEKNRSSSTGVPVLRLIGKMNLSGLTIMYI